MRKLCRSQHISRNLSKLDFVKNSLKIFLSVVLFGYFPQAIARDLRVAAAISLKPLLTDQKLTISKLQTTYVFSGSQVLLQQLKSGAPFDIFIAADKETAEQALKSWGSSSQQLALFSNPLRLATTTAQTKQSVVTILQNSKRVALGSESVPVGRLARSYLTDLDMLQRLKGRLVVAEHVAQISTYLQNNAVDVGFIYASECNTHPGLNCKTLDGAKTYSAHYSALAAPNCISEPCQTYMRELQRKDFLTAAFALGFEPELSQ